MRELLATLSQEDLPGAVSDEHPKSTALDQDPAVDQQVDTLGGRCRIDPVECGKLIGGWRTLTFGQRALEHCSFYLLSDLHEERTTFFHEFTAFSGVPTPALEELNQPSPHRYPCGSLPY